MTTQSPLFIPKHKGAPGPEAFDALRSQGIALIQELAGSVWTDYNAHDPGVTILEQLCYALTDLFYRLDFPVEDFLAGAGGTIDWARQGLLTPESAFPCRPATASDYRAAILAQVPGLENAWVEAVEDQGAPTGLYRVRLRLRNTLRASDDANSRETQIRERVQQVFAQIRNLCEDLAAIDFVPTSDYVLTAQVSIREDADPAEILARIYLSCRTALAGPATFLPYDRAVSAGIAPEEIFRGPFTSSGMIERDGGAPERNCTTADILAGISAIDGVEGVRSLAQLDSAPGMKSLYWPKNDHDIGVELFVGNRPAKVSLHELTMRYGELDISSRGSSYEPSGIAAILPPPRGEARSFADYQSVQYQFPAIYGLGPYGIVESEGAERKAQSEQLQAYLLMFDQPMADFLAGLNNLRQLYSATPDPEKTYFSQLLDETAFPGIDGLNARSIGKSKANYNAGVLDGFLKTYPHDDRAKRLLDYLLALYGERFQDDCLRRSAKAESEEEQEALVQGRIAYLDEIAALTRDRGAAADLLKAPGLDNRSGLEAKLSHLLGFHKTEQSGQSGLRLVEHNLLQPFGGATVDPSRRFRVSLLLRTDHTQAVSQEVFRDLAAQAVEAACPAHIQAELVWLEETAMRRFDGLYQTWWSSFLAARNGGGQDFRKVDEKARALESFLRQRHGKEQGAE